ncbi:MAG: superinfection exclusion B family protein [Acidobacteriota bacterium]|nr:superinfection exclusion B family protein [Acidobacteriota bacterium]
MLDLKKAVEWVKLAPRHLLGILLTAAMYLVMPGLWLEYLGLGSVDQVIRPWVSGVLMISAGLVLAHGFALAADYVRDKFGARSERKMLEERLNNLAEDERQVLARFLANNTKTQVLSYQYGPANGLEAADILFRSSNIGSGDCQFSYTIQPWAWDALHRHPEIVGMTVEELD